jgi:hypothetical protein
MSPSEQQVLVDHVVVETTQSFERVIEAFEGQIGRKGYEAYQHVVTSSRTPEEPLIMARGFLASFILYGQNSILLAIH